ncbi:TonB-dependent receptor [Achromobacter xylosoxidans]
MKSLIAGIAPVRVNRLPLVLVSASMWTLGIGPLHAEEATTLPTVTVTATRGEASIASIPGSVQVIEAEEIKRQSGAGRKVADVLATLVPGLAPSSGTMTNYGQSLRGRNVLVLIDGVPQNASRDNYRQLNSIAPESIERVEVVSGASSLYGAGATGGMINIITKRNKGQDLAFSSRVGITADKDFHGDGMAYELFQSATGRKGAFDWYLSGDFVKRGGQFDALGQRIPQDTSQGSEMDTRNHDLTARFGFDFSPDRRLTLGLQEFQDKQRSDYGFQAVAGEARAVSGLDLDDQPKTLNRAVNLNYTDRAFFGQRLQAESYWRHNEALFYPDRPRKKAGITATDSRATVYGLRLAMESQLPSFSGIQGTLTYGGDYEREQLTQDGRQYTVKGLVYTPTGRTLELGPDMTTQTRALFLQSAWEMQDWTLRAGVRRQWIDSNVKDSVAYGDIQATGVGNILPGGKLKYNATLYNLGVVRHLSDAQDVFVNFSQGFTLPDIQRFLRDVRSDYDIQQLNSQALKVDSYEIGWRGAWDAVQASLTAYRNNSDVTQFYDAKDRVLRLINQKERVSGVEASLDVNVARAWKVGGSYAYTKGATKQNGSWTALPATRIAPPKFTAYVSYAPGTYSVRLQGVRVGGYDAAARDKNGRETVGYTLLDLLASVELPKGRVDVGVYNLTNRDYYSVFMQANARAPWPRAQGRTVAVSYSLDW